MLTSSHDILKKHQLYYRNCSDTEKDLYNIHDQSKSMSTFIRMVYGPIGLQKVDYSQIKKHKTKQHSVF